MVRNGQTTLLCLGDTVGENPRGHQVEQHVAGNHDEGTLNHGPPGNLERLNERGLNLLIVGGSLGEDGGLLQAETHVEADGDHHDGEQERDTPTPDEEGVLEVLRVGGGVKSDEAGQNQHEAVGENEANGGTQLGPHGGAGALTILRVLAGEQSRAGPFAAQAQALAEAHDGQHGRCPESNLVVGGQQADDEGRYTHGEQRTDEGCLTTNLVAEVAKNNGTEGTRDEGDTEGCEGGQ